MHFLDRREFIQQSAGLAGLIASGYFAHDTFAAQAAQPNPPRGANERLNIAVIGVRGRGGDHISGLAGRHNCRVTHICDVDTAVTPNAVQRVQKAQGGAAPAVVQDLRRIMDNKEIHAVTIATPNHWHSLAGIWAMQAGKHVYVEKPSSHNVREGRVTVDIARKHNVIVQHGTQSRSDAAWANTVEVIKSGKFGRLLVSRALCYKIRNSIGMRPNAEPPKEVDFNLWLGPAQRTPFHANLVHYNWHWFWAFGNGDIGNQGVHQMDIARWAIQGATLPRSVVSVGGRYGYTDQGETPNTQVTLMDFGQSKLIFEVRGLRCPGYRGQTIGNVFHLEEGVIVGHRFFARGQGNGEALPQMNPRRGPGGGNHFGNFIAAVRSRRTADLNADIEEGHYSSACCHLANISVQMGTNAAFTPRTNAFGDNRDAIEALERMEAHLSGEPYNLRLADLRLRVGPLLEVQARTENFNGNAAANRLLTRQYREGFVVPDRVS